MRPLRDLIESKRTTPETQHSKLEEDIEGFRRMAIDLGATPPALLLEEGRRATRFYFLDGRTLNGQPGRIYTAER